MKRCFGSSRHSLSLLASAVIWIVLGQPAKAVDEIQVYNAGIAAPGQFTIQQHLNYVPLGVKDPPFPGGLISNNSINAVSYTHLRAHETVLDLVCRLLLEKKK